MMDVLSVVVISSQSQFDLWFIFQIHNSCWVSFASVDFFSYLCRCDATVKSGIVTHSVCA